MFSYCGGLKLLIVALGGLLLIDLYAGDASPSYTFDPIYSYGIFYNLIVNLLPSSPLFIGLLTFKSYQFLVVYYYY
tara:strand:+ start:1930 stop:2157 length:228 start_codon:yes stop_codon:yes gene_type:complete